MSSDGLWRSARGELIGLLLMHTGYADRAVASSLVLRMLLAVTWRNQLGIANPAGIFLERRALPRGEVGIFCSRM